MLALGQLHPSDLTFFHGEEGEAEELVVARIWHQELVLNFASLTEVNQLSVVESGLMSVVHSIGRVDTTAVAFFDHDFDDAQILHDRHCSQNF